MNNSEISRKIFFWTLVVLFWLVSAIIIGYTFGYRFNFERGVFVYAGSITLKTTPQKPDIYLNGVLVPSPSFSRINNSYHISGIKPGEYLIEVKTPDHQTWSKKASVHSGISTEFWNIILVQNSYEHENYNSSGIQRFFISPHKNLTAFSQQNGNEFSVEILDPGTLVVKQVFSSTDYVFTNNEKENIEWTPEANRLIIPVLKNNEKNYLIATIDTKEILDLKSLAKTTNLSHVRWDPKSKDVLFFMTDGNLYRMDLNSPENKKLIAEDIASYDLSPKALFYFRLPEGIVYKTNFDAVETPQQITTSAPDDMSDNSYQIIVYDDDRIVFLNNEKHYLYIYNKGQEDTYFQKLSENVLGSQFSDDGKKLLYWTDREILAYFARKWDEQPARIENEIMPITRLSDQIKNVQWTRDYEHVLFTNNNKIKMIEIDNRDHRNMMDVISLNDSDSIIINNFTDGKIYYTEKNDQQQNVLRSMYFPEYTTLLDTFFPGSSQQTETN